MRSLGEAESSRTGSPWRRAGTAGSVARSRSFSPKKARTLRSLSQRTQRRKGNQTPGRGTWRQLPAHRWRHRQREVLQRCGQPDSENSASWTFWSTTPPSSNRRRAWLRSAKSSWNGPSAQNIFSFFFFTKAALKHFKTGGVIINTASVTAYKGSPQLLDYSSTKGAIVAFTRSLSQNLAEKGIRVNGVALGPIWTPLIPSTFPAKEVATFGSDVPLKRPGQPEEVATCYLFLASDDSSYMTGQILHPNGGSIVNG